MIRVLLLGVGRWGNNHLRVLRSEDVDLYVVDTDDAQLARLHKMGIPLDHLGKDPYAFTAQVDAAIVVTPAQSHFDLASHFLRAGRDVFVEKPITLHSGEARQLAELAAEKQRILQVGHIFRFDPASTWLRDAVARGDLGRVKMVRGAFSGFKRPRNDSGVTYADGIHFIDLFNYVLGGCPARVHASFQDTLGRGMEDESLVQLEYRNEDGQPIWGRVESGYNVPGKYREVLVIGEKATAVCDFNVAQYKVKLWANHHRADGNGRIETVEGSMQQLEFPPEEPLRAELKAFLRSVETRERPLADAWAGYDSVRIIEAAEESARSGQWTAVAS